MPFQNLTYQKPAINNIGESKSDYEAVLEVSKVLGMYDEVSGGRTVSEWVKSLFDDIRMG